MAGNLWSVVIKVFPCPTANYEAELSVFWGGPTWIKDVIISFFLRFVTCQTCFQRTLNSVLLPAGHLINLHPHSNHHHAVRWNVRDCPPFIHAAQRREESSESFFSTRPSEESLFSPQYFLQTSAQTWWSCVCGNIFLDITFDAPCASLRFAFKVILLWKTAKWSHLLSFPALWAACLLCWLAVGPLKCWWLETPGWGRPASHTDFPPESSPWEWRLPSAWTSAREC